MYDTTFPSANVKRLHPEWHTNPKLRFKILEFLRVELKLMTEMKEQRLNISVECTYEFDPNNDDSNCVITNTCGVSIIGSDGENSIDYFSRDLVKLKHMNLQHYVSKANTKRHALYFGDEYIDRPFGSHVLLLREGLCVWFEKKYYLVFSLNGVKAVVNKYHVPGRYDGSTRQNILSQDPKFANISKNEILRIAHSKKSSETECFGFI
jgi:hypothetical protein